jgi:hypothetical protein
MGGEGPLSIDWEEVEVNFKEIEWRRYREKGGVRQKGRDAR